jgi:anaerobic selenocysteine-containing dehydrogenase
MKMKELTRREFLKLGGASVGVVTGIPAVLSAMELNEHGADYSPKTLKQRQAIPTTCLQCNVEDGLLCFVEDGRLVKIEGNPEHPGTRGRICAKGNAGINTVYSPDRLLYPIKRVGARGEGKWKRITWDEALNEMAERIKEARQRDPNEVMFHYGRDRTGGYTKRFMAAIGSNTIGNHTSTCEASKKAGMQFAWGPDIETPDFENTKYIINFGGNIYEASYFHNPYVQRIIDGRVKNKAKMVMFDVRLSNTAGKADEWFPVFPGTDGAVALAMANVIMSEGLANTQFINDWTNVSSEQLAKHLAKYTPEWAEKESGVPAEDIRRIAIEFAKCAPRCTTYTYRGPCKHFNGSYNEKCTMLLNIIVGNIDKEGGYCLPRGMKWSDPELKPPKPAKGSILAHPPEYPLALHHVSHHIAHGILEGRQEISVYIWYMYNPCYANPDSGTWEALLKDTEKLPFTVAIDGFISESSDLADIILPDSSYLQRHDPESMPSALLPWVGARIPVVKNLGEQREIRDILRDLAERIGPEVAQYFKETPEEYLAFNMNSVPGLKENGGLDFIRKHGVYPLYDKDAKPEFETYKAKGFKSSDSHSDDGKIHVYVHKWEEYGFEPMPYYWPIPEHQKMGSNDLVMTTFKINVHVQSRTSSCKWLSEISHSNPMWINPKTATERGIKEGDLVRVTSKIGYLVTKAYMTEGIHPRVVAISTHAGHWRFGPVAQAKKGMPVPYGNPDADVSKNLWWGGDIGVHPNRIVPISTDPIGGGQAWMDTVVKVEKAKTGDKYGTVHYDLEAAKKAYLETLQYATKKRDEGGSGGH